MNHKQKDYLINDLITVLEQLVVRFPHEGYAIDGKCKCLQYEDYNDCRHLQAKEVLELAKKK